MTADELRAFCEKHELSGEAFARLVDVQSGRTVRRWLAADREIPGPVSQLLRLLSKMPATKRTCAIKWLMSDPP